MGIVRLGGGVVRQKCDRSEEGVKRDVLIVDPDFEEMSDLANVHA